MMALLITVEKVRNQIFVYRWALLSALTILFLVFSFNRPELNVQKPTKTQTAEITNVPQLPEQISPEDIVALNNGNTPYLLVNADDPYPRTLSSLGPIRLIYYTKTPSFRSAQKRAKQDRQLISTGTTDSLKINSQRLTGTPLEWQHLGLNFLNSPFPKQPLPITALQLSEAIKDNVDLQLIDIRPITSEVSEVSTFPQALHWMPDEVLNNLPKLSKENWIVLIGYSNEDTQPIVFELFQRGYLLTSFLDGGYPAWVGAVDR
jgi:rhodanese-related sulfurtransferase